MKKEKTKKLFSLLGAGPEAPLPKEVFFFIFFFFFVLFFFFFLASRG